jgi:hypothetical protein
VTHVVALTLETAVPVLDLQMQLTIFQHLKRPLAWTGHFRGSPARWKPADGESAVEALLPAPRNPVVRPVSAAKLARRPRALNARVGSVTVPESEEALDDVLQANELPTAHTEIQWLLLKLGHAMGGDVWVARNDRSRRVPGHRLTELPRLNAELPLPFDDATKRTIERIDVLWLKGHAIVAAFAIESTTSIYSGLLSMSDLVAMQPNLNIPLSLVAPDERREKVLVEVNRPTFSRLSPPLAEVCRDIAFSGLRKRLSQVASFVRYLKPDFLNDLSDSCEIEEA